ncbi:Holliday junction resolvase RuvX [Candidatus Parcubacteria bacterium]|nr:MAG: Holliday junction resolvase RuvX [Candidatus Parcubacteria bacterium]
MRQRLLGIDYGDKNIGLALADLGSIALPYKIINNNGFEGIVSQLKKIIAAENIEVIVVGLPHSLSGETNERFVITRKFIDALTKELDIKIVGVDEQMTSKLYDKQGVKKDIDKHAAAAILDTYLAQQN